MSFYARIARYYDSEHHDKDEDLPLYRAIADATDGHVLVIGSGTGRIAIGLAEVGHTVHGIEIEPAMFDRARAKRDRMPALAERLSLHLGDALEIALPEQFDLVLIPYNTFMHFLDLEVQLALLARVRAWLRPGGLLVLDLPNAGDVFGSLDVEAVTLERTFLEQESGNLVMQQSVSSLDRTAQEMTVTWIYDEIGTNGVVHRTVVPTTIHYYFRSELELLLRLSGFELEALYGDFDQSAFEAGAPRMIAVASAGAAD
jgi:SAM-dependent methyltransferase